MSNNPDLFRRSKYTGNAMTDVTLRDVIAWVALHAIVSRSPIIDDRECARYSYAVADAMLAAREKGRE